MIANDNKQFHEAKGSVDKFLIVLSLGFVVGLVACLAIFPEGSKNVANMIFSKLTLWFGTEVLIFTFLGLVLLVGIMASKYGKIKLGAGKPEHSTFKWISMMIACGLGSATVYWAFIEWAYYISNPGLSIEPFSQKAFEMSVAYTQFHWGFSAWTLYALVGVPMCYHYYVRKNAGLSLSSFISSSLNIKRDGVLGRIVDILFIFICFGGLSITLGLSVPMVTEVFCSLLGIKPVFAMNVVLIIVISIVYSLSSYIGIEKGMARISSWTTKMAIGMCVGILILGPGLFIISNTTNSLGLMLQNFVQMSLFTDPVGKGRFPEAWTIFYWLYWITYAPFTGIYIAKISKGRTIRSVILNTLISGSIGCFFFFGVIGSLTMERQISNKVDVVGMLGEGKDNPAIVQVLQSLPLGTVFIVVFCILSILFLATTLDGSAFTLASTATKNAKNEEEPHPLHRLFWCVLLALVPLAMIFIKADLNTIKTAAIITGVPIMFIMLYMLYGWIKWMVSDVKKYKFDSEGLITDILNEDAILAEKAEKEA